MEYTQKVVYQSNYWYNDGLKKAKIRDMTGAVTSLKKSLQFNSENIAARNLLGLVYYGRGEVGEALVEWILSKNLRPKDNIANYYIQKIQKSPADLDTINQAIRKYNQSLVYCEQGGEDMAIIQLKQVVAAFPGFLRAYQRLALLYLHTEQYSRARHVLKEARKLDTTNEITLRYMHELTNGKVRKEAAEAVKKDEKSQTVTYNVGNDTIIQPASALKDNSGRMTFINILIGLVVGVAVMWFLIMPAVNKSTSQKTNKQVTAFSDKIAEEEAQISALKTELESYRASSEESENAQQTAASTQESYEIVMEMYSHYLQSDMKDSAMVDSLKNVNPDALGTLGKSRYEEMTDSIYPRYADALYTEALQAYEVANYSTTISDLEVLVGFDEGYSDGKAVYLLYKAYDKTGDTDNANTWKDKLDKDYPDVDTSDLGESDSESDTSGSSKKSSSDDTEE